MTREEIALWAAALMFAVNAWFTRRLVVSIDNFKAETRLRLGAHDVSLARVDERHRIEDAGDSDVLHVHRRKTDTARGEDD